MEESKPPAYELLELADQVTKRIVTYRFAVSLVASRDWTALTGDDVGATRQLVEADLNRDPERASVLAHLTVLAAVARWGENRESPWWQAADLYVDVTRMLLSRLADGDRLNEAAKVVTRQIAVLDERLANLRRRRFRWRHRTLIDAEEQEWAETLLGAAALVLDPYLSNYDKQAVDRTLNGWLDPSVPGSAYVLFTPESGKQYRRVPGDFQVREDLNKRLMPTPVQAADIALAYLDTALTKAQGHIRGICLFAKMQALDVLLLAGDRGKEVELEEMKLVAARESFDYLDGAQAPEQRLILIELLVRTGVIPMPHHLSDLLSYPFDELRRRYGPDRALSTLIMAGGFVRASDILAELQSSGEEILGHVVDRRRILSYYDMIVHRLPQNRYACDGEHLTWSKAVVESILPQLNELRRESPAAVAATMLHLISHIQDADTPAAVALLEDMPQWDPAFAEAHKWLIIHVGVSARRRYAELLATSGKLLEALQTFEGMAEDQLRLIVGLRLPATLLQDFARNAFRLSLLEPGEGSSKPDILVPFLLGALNPTVRSLMPSRDPKHERFVHSFGILVDQRVRESVSLLSFTHHCMFKGVDVGILLDNAQRRSISPHSSRLLQKIRAREAIQGPYVPPRIDEIEENLEWVPSGASSLYYVALGESAPDSREDGSIGSLRKAFDRSVTSDLLRDLSDRPDLSSRDPFTEFNRVRRLLPQDTVLLSLFVGELSNTATPETPVNNSCLTMFTMTVDDWEGYVVRLNAMSGPIAVESGDQIVLLHPLAGDVAELRLRLTADAHSQSVSPHARRLLEGHYSRMGGPPAEALLRWRAEGRTHLCIWPHGPLHYVPFHLLHHDGRALADDWTVTTLPTPAVLGEAKSVPTERRIVFAGTSISHPAFVLPAQGAVSEHVRRLAAQVQPSRLLVDAEVTPSSLLAAAETATHLHISAHGSHDAEAAWFQCLYLNPDPDNDGRLFAFQIAQADLSTVDLVTLSACESAMGRYDLNDNLRGLPAAFLLAGASTVIGALWPVTPDAASTFFEQLYLRLHAGDGKRAAFRAAQLVTRQRCPAYRDWGAFAYIGGLD
ncbi:CHAT domain-containing protein [Streptomyces sp. DT193]|uniref:CHAT domain-containing protein n=1 Tax=Streptomyces sp. DT193 TaxID=3393418 RepID=UPI003CEF4BD8